MAELQERTTKLRIWSMQTYASMQYWEAWKKLNLTFWNHQRRYVWRNKGEAFVGKKTLPTVGHGSSMEVDPLCFGLFVAAGGTGTLPLCQWKEERIPPNIKKFKRLMFEGQSSYWSWKEVGLSSKTMIQSITQNQPWSTSIIENLWRDLKHAVHAWPKNICELKVFCQEEWGKIARARIQFNFISIALFTVDCHKDALHSKQENGKSALSPQTTYEVNDSLVGEKPSNSGRKKLSDGKKSREEPGYRGLPILCLPIGWTVDVSHIKLAGNLESPHWCNSTWNWKSLSWLQDATVTKYKLTGFPNFCTGLSSFYSYFLN